MILLPSPATNEKKRRQAKAPAEKLTSNKTIFLSNDKRIHKATIPINDIALTIKTLISAYQNAIIKC